MRIVLIGASGQLGRSIQKQAQKNFQISSPDSRTLNLILPGSMKRYLNDSKPDLVINTGAWTDVDGAEDHQAEAYLTNAIGPSVLAAWCQHNRTDLIHISSDYVFNAGVGKPLTEIARAQPINCYGASKLKGENMIFANLPGAFIMRSAWLYSEDTNSFAMRMLKLGQENKEIKVVTDQIGSPTYVPQLGKSILNLANHINKRRLFPSAFAMNSLIFQGGLLHAAGRGMASRFSFVSYLYNLAMLKGLPLACHKLTPVHSDFFPAPATRPAFSALDSNRLASIPGCNLPDWQIGLQEFMSDLTSQLIQKVA